MLNVRLVLITALSPLFTATATRDVYDRHGEKLKNNLYTLFVARRIRSAMCVHERHRACVLYRKLIGL